MVSDQAPQSDTYHWCQLRQGSSVALEILYDRYFPHLFRYGLQLVSDRACVLDVLQDFFVDLFTHRTTLSEVQQVRPYLYICFRRRLLRHQRKVSNEELRLEKIELPTEHSPEHAMILQQLGEEKLLLLRQALMKLSQRQQEAVFLRFYEELSYEEIATVLELKETKYARTLIYRTIQVLREEMRDHRARLTLYSLIPIPEFLKLIKHW